MPITFPVDAVQPAPTIPATTSIVEVIQSICGVRPEAFGSEGQTLISPIVQKVPGRSGEAKMEDKILKDIQEALMKGDRPGVERGVKLALQEKTDSLIQVAWQSGQMIAQSEARNSMFQQSWPSAQMNLPSWKRSTRAQLAWQS